ncbi:hypothetical protein EDC04DRAFT_2887438 [Pisolithus marmoratus]|nr:hypothetical protein EDC04DRAFT_2887438 [Pisolithus marmoratus]
MPPAPNKYKAVVNIIKEMWDGIKPELDGPPSKEEIEKAHKEILALLDKGHIEVPLLGSQEEEDIIIQDKETPEWLQQHFLVREDSPGNVAEDFHDRLFNFHPLDNPNRDHNSVCANIDEVTQQNVEEDMCVKEDIYPTAARIL